MAGSPRLFEPELPPGFHYRENFITEADERLLLHDIKGKTEHQPEPRHAELAVNLAGAAATSLVQSWEVSR
jgi:hypothetical protein